MDKPVLPNFGGALSKLDNSEEGANAFKVILHGTGIPLRIRVCFVTFFKTVLSWRTKNDFLLFYKNEGVWRVVLKNTS